VVLLRTQIILLAKRKRSQFKNLLVIGITGSYGKTSTKEFLYTILSQKFNVLKTEEHQNSEIGISQCILNDLKPEHKIFIVEMGAYGPGGIKLLCNIVRPEIGILMGANEQHLSLFGSMKKIISAEGGKELIKALPDKGLAVFNGDNKYALELYQGTEKSKRIISSALQNLDFAPDIWAEKIIAHKDYIFFRGCSKEGCESFKVYLSGVHFVSNLLAAICVAKALGLEDEEIAQACLKINSPENTMKIFKGIKDLIIIDDSYSANPTGVIAALEYLRIYEGKKMIILPSLIELGKTAKEIHQIIGEKIGEVCDAVIVTTKDHFREIGEGFLNKGGKAENVLFADNPDEILEIIKKFWDPGDVVLLEGRVPEKLLTCLIKPLEQNV
jgi:UDP-N-acetylmuramoyl-tripeptide--D-alanyl-D-alanine ligase